MVFVNGVVVKLDAITVCRKMQYVLHLTSWTYHHFMFDIHSDFCIFQQRSGDIGPLLLEAPSKLLCSGGDPHFKEV